MKLGREMFGEWEESIRLQITDKAMTYVSQINTSCLLAITFPLTTTIRFIQGLHCQQFPLVALRHCGTKKYSPQT